MPIAWNQYIAQGVGNGTQTAWQIVDAGGFPIQMPTNGALYANGVLATGYTVSNGIATFSAAPASGVVLTLLPGSGYSDAMWWPVQSTRSLKPALYTAKFGDGYQQNTPQGINFNPEKWDLQFKFNDRADADALLAFLDAQGGYLPFTWRSPRGPNPIRVLCQNYSDITKTGAAFTLMATFNQVYGQ